MYDNITTEEMLELDRRGMNPPASNFLVNKFEDINRMVMNLYKLTEKYEELGYSSGSYVVRRLYSMVTEMLQPLIRIGYELDIKKSYEREALEHYIRVFCNGFQQGLPNVMRMLRENNALYDDFEKSCRRLNMEFEDFPRIMRQEYEYVQDELKNRQRQQQQNFPEFIRNLIDVYARAVANGNWGPENIDELNNVLAFGVNKLKIISGEVAGAVFNNIKKSGVNAEILLDDTQNLLKFLVEKNDISMNMAQDAFQYAISKIKIEKTEENKKPKVEEKESEKPKKNQEKQKEKLELLKIKLKRYTDFIESGASAKDIGIELNYLDRAFVEAVNVGAIPTEVANELMKDAREMWLKKVAEQSGQKDITGDLAKGTQKVLEKQAKENSVLKHIVNNNENE